MYTPNKNLLEKYAEVMVDFALWHTKGLNRGDTVLLDYELVSKPLAIEIYKRILKKGGNVILNNTDDEFELEFYKNSTIEQAQYKPDTYYKGLIEQIDHRIRILSENNPKLFKDIDPKKLIEKKRSTSNFKKWMFEKEEKGKLSWTLCLYGTEGMAKEAGLSIEEYWEQIINACYLNESNPIETWRNKYKELETIKNKLNSLDIESLHIESKNTNLWIKYGEGRQFIGGRGANIPSFELFTSPDWRGTNGVISFDQPLYRYGNIIRGINLKFKDGIVINSSATENNDLLAEMLKTTNANKIGEFSLTDKRFSKINKFMAETLYDENFGGEFGNTHIAIGSSYHDTFKGNSSDFSESDWENLGFNDSPEHTDIISTENRVVTSVSSKGDKTIIYKDGEFCL